jgi:hypothetical protein
MTKLHTAVLRFTASDFANVPGGYRVVDAAGDPSGEHWANRDTSYALPEGYTVSVLISGELAIRDPDGEICDIAPSEPGNGGGDPILVTSRIARLRRSDS